MPVIVAPPRTRGVTKSHDQAKKLLTVIRPSSTQKLKGAFARGDWIPWIQPYRTVSAGTTVS